MDNTIVLIIWGCKGGHRILCSDNIDYQESSIANTTKDIRSFVRFNLVNLTTYAIEFTDKYKIFTIYRSSNDSGTGGYIAITVYIPHNLKIEGLRPILDDMMNAYFNEYVHPILCSYLPGKYDNIELFLHILKTKAVTKPDANMYSYKSSEQNNDIHLRLYDSIDEVDEFFASPYRKEFFCSQEVMFMSRDMYNHIPDTLTFNLFDENNIIKTVSEPETLPVLSINFNDIVSLKINAMSCDKSQSCPINTATDTIEIAIKKEYCEDRIIKGRVSELLRNGTLKESNKIISIGNIGNFTYKNYPIKFCLNGNICPDNVVYVEKQNQLLEVCNSKVEINGQDLASDWNIYLTPLQGNKPIKVGSFKPKEYVDNDKPYEVESSLLSFKVRVDKNVTADRFNVFIGNVIIDVPIDRKESEKFVTIYLPNNIDSAPNWKEYGNETVVSYNEKENTLIVSSKILRYTLEIPEFVRDCIQNWDFKIKDKSCKKNSIFSDSPYTVEINSDDDISKGKLYIDKDEYRFSVYDNIISPCMICIVPDKDYSYYEYTIDRKKININSLVYFPYTDSVSVPNSECSKEKNIYRYKIKEKEKTDNKVTNTVTTGGTVSNGEQPTRTITLIGCKGLKIDDKEIKEDKYTRPINSENTAPIRIEKGKKELCVVYRKVDTYESDKDQRKKNESNGFKVEYSDDNITVEYKKPKSRFVKFISSKTGIMTIIGVLAVLAIAVIGYLLYNPNDGEYVMIIKYEVEDNYFDITLEELKTKSSTDKIKVESNTIYVYFNKDGYDFLKEISITAKLSNSESKTEELKEYINQLNTDNKMHRKMTTIRKDVKIPSDLQTAYSELVNEIENKTDKKVSTVNIPKIIGENPVAVDKVIKVIYKKWDNEYDNKINLKKDIVKQYGSYKGTENGYFYDIQQSCNEYDEQQEKQIQAAKNNLINEAKKYMNKLCGDSNCTSETVTEVSNWYKNLIKKEKSTIKGELYKEHTHVVKDKETLYSIATKYGCDVDSIKKRNKLSNNSIEVGQELKVKFVFDFNMAIKAYDAFFKAESGDDIKKIVKDYLHYFSEYQQNIINEYQTDYYNTKNAYEGMKFPQGVIF